MKEFKQLISKLTQSILKRDRRYHLVDRVEIVALEPYADGEWHVCYNSFNGDQEMSNQWFSVEECLK